LFLDGRLNPYISSPPWIFATICTLIGAWNAGNLLNVVMKLSNSRFPLRFIDRTGERFFHQTAWWWVVMIGYIISLSTMATGGRYFSMFLMTTGYCGTSHVSQVVTPA
jgi:hypothetical protein